MVSRTFIATDEPLNGSKKEDPTLAWMRREHPDVLAMRETPHEFVHWPIRDPKDTCPPEGNAGCVCEACWERKSFRAHRGSSRRQR